ncbi:MAG: haloacid dehalogenase type II [Acidiferrobacterales bacterium]|nr:haloacid dehalogenase type II [Acidiferrobacterales bacterium]
MTTTLAFDIYGTLIDTDGVTDALELLVAERAGEFSRRWREKQLEYSFRRGLMHDYQEFAVCVRQALDFVCLSPGFNLSDPEKQSLMDSYRTLPAFPDVKTGLDDVKQAGFRSYAFSNGSAAAVGGLLEHAGIDDYFIDVVSVDEIKTFKPDPAVYLHFLERAGARPQDAWLISGNPFDVVGALSVGMRAAWVQRSNGTVFDPWELQPTVTITTLTELAGAIK